MLSKSLIINLWKQSQVCALIIESLWREEGFVIGRLFLERENASGSARTEFCSSRSSPFYQVSQQVNMLLEAPE
jgi:hypothetical protein